MNHRIPITGTEPDADHATVILTPWDARRSYPPGSMFRGSFPLRDVVTFPNGRKRLRPRFRRNRPIWGAALRHRGIPALAAAFALGLLLMWFLFEIVAPFFDGQVAAALGR